MMFFDYFTLAVIAIVICFIAGKATYLRMARGINPIVVGRGEGRWRIIEMCALGALLLWAVEVILHACHSRYDLFPRLLHLTWLDQQPVWVIGVVLMGVGLVFFVLAFLNFGESWRIGLDRKSPGTLVTGGVFSITRNPIYVGFNLISVGVLLIYQTWFFFIVTILAIIAVHTQILREEEFLRNLYGKSYEAYRARTARYLIW